MTVLDHSPTLATRGIIVYGTSTIYQTIFITKMTVRSGPFSELENACPSEISNHFPNWKGTAHPGPFFELKNDFPSINNTSVLPPNLGVISSFFNKEVVSTSPILFLKYTNFFILDRGFTKISVIYSSMEIYWRTTSLFWTSSWRM
jgi:hypothetical protein